MQYPITDYRAFAAQQPEKLAIVFVSWRFNLQMDQWVALSDNLCSRFLKTLRFIVSAVLQSISAHCLISKEQTVSFSCNHNLYTVMCFSGFYEATLHLVLTHSFSLSLPFRCEFYNLSTAADWNVYYINLFDEVEWWHSESSWSSA